MPDTRVGRFLGPKGSGDSSRGGDEGGPGPPGEKRDKQSAPCKGEKQLTPNKEGGNMEKEEEEKKS